MNMIKTYCLLALLSFLLSVLFCRILIPLLKRWKAGQNILSYVEEHKSKSGTPTMGGLAFITAAVLSSALLLTTADRTTVVTLTVSVAYLVVGFLDDLLKKKHKENLGLKAWQKLLFQAFVAVFAGIYAYRAGVTSLHIPFFNQEWEIGAWIVPLAVFAFLSTVNCVNLTDGLDGLAAGTGLPFFLFLGITVVLQSGNASLAGVCFALCGALCGYLLFNAPPASVFMGDTGSLALGGFASCIAVFSGNALYIPVIGLVFVLSGVSVILQVCYFKATGGKRIFLMSPVHHHFQQKGYSESRISYAYAVATACIGLLTVAVSI